MNWVWRCAIALAGLVTQVVAHYSVANAEELGRLTDVAAQAGLQSALGLKLEREKALAAQRSSYYYLTARLRASDERRLQLERELEPLRQRITELQLKEQAARLGTEQYSQLLADAQADLEAVARSIEEGHVRLAGLQGEIDRLHRDIQALGAVNLAALDELTTARERKQFLDAQSADLTEAMTTLEDAIKKIDAETPPELDLHLIVDNYATHKHSKVKAWLKRHPRFHIHFIPTSSSWLNVI